MLNFKSVSAVEILDSRSRPTLAVRVVLADGSASPGPGCHRVRRPGRGRRWSWRDGDPARYAGKRRPPGGGQRQR